MEIEPSPSPSPSPNPESQVVARKLWKIARIVMVMLRKGIAKTKVAVDFNLHLLLKRSKLAATKAIANTIVTLHHNRSQNDAVVYPRDYEFSCSNSPSFPFHVIKRNNNNKNNRRSLFSKYDDVSTVHKVLEMLNNNKVVEASPLPGFEKSPIAKKKLIRITDSPFPLKNEEEDEEEEDHHVDVAAEEFIKRFYKDLNSQQKFAAIDSPYHCNSWDR